MEDISDRELLEAAAKAAGYALDYSIRPDGKAFYHSDRNAMALADGGWFAPLTDDGDALRLAVKLGLNVMTCGREGAATEEIQIGGIVQKTIFQPCSIENRDAATRRAIVRAAALSKGA